METREFRAGDIVRHFKRETVEPDSDKYPDIRQKYRFELEAREE